MSTRDLENLASQAGTDADVAIKAVEDAQTRTKLGQFNIGQAAGTFDILTATGDVMCEIDEVYVKTAGVGLTSAKLDTNHVTPKSIVGSTVLASLTLDAILTLVTSKFVLPSGKKIQGTIVGTGSAGLVYIVVKWTPLTAGATLA